MQKQRLAFSHLSGLGRLILSTSRIIECQPRKKKSKPTKRLETRTKIKLSPTTLFLPIVTFRPNFLRKINVKIIDKEALLLPGSMPPR